MTVIEVSDELATVMKAQAAAQGLTLDTWLKKLVAEGAAPESEQEEKTKLEWIRAAAQEGFEAIEKGEYTELVSGEQLSDFVRRIHDEVKADLAAERHIG